MKFHFNVILLFVLFSSSALPLPVTNPSKPPRVCGLPSAGSLNSYNDSVVESNDRGSVNLANAFTEIYAFPEIQNYISVIAPTQICLSGIFLNKNIYQYDKFLITLEMQNANNKNYVLPLVFQAASIQAEENTGPKQWLGFQRSLLVSNVANILATASFQNLQSTYDPTSFSPLSASELPNSSQVDISSRSYVFVPDVQAGWTTYLISQLRILDTGNPFTSINLLDVEAVQIQGGTGQVRIAEVSDFFSLYSLFEDLQSQAEPADLSTDSEALKDMTARP